MRIDARDETLSQTFYFIIGNPPYNSERVLQKNISYNPYIPNIDAISGALFTLRIQHEYTQTQCDEGARDDIDIW